MNTRDRAFIDRLDEVLRTAGSMFPPNPMDIKAIAPNLKAATRACKELTQAIGAYRAQEWDFAEEHLTAAGTLLAAAPAG
ncbi:MAG: hypothetical protein ACOH1Y_14265 [Propionicimonas sp.]